jgi:hypothetical protein
VAHNRRLNISAKKENPMSAIDELGKRGAAVFGIAREAVDTASPKVKAWLKTGAALGAARTGARVASGVVRRNPGLAIAAVAVGAGYLAYTAYRKRAAAAAEHVKTLPIEATATVVETRKRAATSRRTSSTKAKTSEPDAQATTTARKAASKTTSAAKPRARKRSVPNT